jgi:hypothetical protein
VKRFGRVAPLAIAVALSACSADAALRRFTIPAHDSLARQFLNGVREDNLPSVDRFIGPESRKIPGLADSIRAAAAQLPIGPIDTVRLVGVNLMKRRDVTSSILTYELHTPHGWGLATLRINEELGLRFVDGFTGQPLPESLEALNSFQRGLARPKTWIFLVIVIGMAAFSLGMAVAAMRAPIPRRVYWAVLALVGAGGIAINWSTGEISSQLLTLRLFSSGVVRGGPAGPWVLSFSFPLGPILVWRRLQRARTLTDATPEHRDAAI